MSFARSDEVGQTPDDTLPRTCADVVALIGRHKSAMREANFGLVAFLINFKDNISTSPLGCVFGKFEVVLQHVPDNFFTGYKFRNFECATVIVLVVVIKHGAEPVSVALDCLGKPATNVGDGLE